MAAGAGAEARAAGTGAVGPVAGPGAETGRMAGWPCGRNDVPGAVPWKDSISTTLTAMITEMVGSNHRCVTIRCAHRADVALGADATGRGLKWAISRSSSTHRFCGGVSSAVPSFRWNWSTMVPTNVWTRKNAAMKTKATKKAALEAELLRWGCTSTLVTSIAARRTCIHFSEVTSVSVIMAAPM